MSSKKSKSNTHGLRQTTLFHSFTGSSPQTPGRRSSISRSKRVAIESSSSDELEAREIRLPKKAPSLDALSDAENHVQQPLRTSSKRRRTFIASDSSDDQGKVTVDKASSLLVDESSYVDGNSPSRKGKLVHRREIKKHLLASDESENLADEVDEERMLDSRLRTRDKKTVFQKNLEKLKRRKLKMDKETDSDQQEESEESGEEQETVSNPFRGAKPSADFNGLANDEESDSDQHSQFIIEDDDEVELPAQFSMQTYGDLSYQFKKIFQLFVHVAVQSPGDRRAFMERQMQDEYFAVPLQMTRRKVSGLRDSLVSSSVWRPEFKRALEDYPDFELTPLDFTVPSCDACNMGGRKSSLVGRVGGSLYKIDGFEPRVSKRKTNNKEFNLGRFCARRGRVFHQFSHWEHSLFQTIVRELDELRLSSSKHGFHRVAYPDGRDPPKDLQDADGLCDWLDERKLIEMEWHKMKEMMESARHLEINTKTMGDL